MSEFLNADNEKLAEKLAEVVDYLSQIGQSVTDGFTNTATASQINDPVSIAGRERFIFVNTATTIASGILFTVPSNKKLTITSMDADAICTQVGYHHFEFVHAIKTPEPVNVPVAISQVSGNATNARVSLLRTTLLTPIEILPGNDFRLDMKGGTWAKMNILIIGYLTTIE